MLGSEAVDQLVCLMFQVTLYGVSSTVPRIFVVLSGVLEACVKFGLGAVREVRDATGDAESGARCPPRSVVVTALPIRIGDDGSDLRRLGADLICSGP